MKKSVVLFGLVALSACGGTSTPVTVETPPEAVTPREAYAAAQLNGSEFASKVYSFAATSRADFPTTGSASFTGSADIYVSQGGGERSFNLIGDAELEADFGRGTVTGTLDNFVASERDSGGNLAYYDATGQIDIGGRRSEIGDDGDPRYFSADYHGTVGVGATNLRFNGDLYGSFRGNRVNQPEGESNVRGFYASSYSDTVPVGNGERDVYMDVFGIAGL